MMDHTFSNKQRVVSPLTERASFGIADRSADWRAIWVTPECRIIPLYNYVNVLVRFSAPWNCGANLESRPANSFCQ